MEITVKLVDGSEHKVDKFTPFDLVVFERKFKIGASALGEQGEQRLEWLCFLVYRSLLRTGQVKAGVDFDAFLEDVLDLDVEQGEEEADAPDPTVKAA